MMVVEGQDVGYGFAHDFGAFEEEVEIEHQLSLRDDALFDHDVDCSQDLLQFLRYGSSWRSSGSHNFHLVRGGI